MRGVDTLAGWRGGWGVNILEDARHSSVLYVCTYFVVQTLTNSPKVRFAWTNRIYLQVTQPGKPTSEPGANAKVGRGWAVVFIAEVLVGLLVRGLRRGAAPSPALPTPGRGHHAARRMHCLKKGERGLQ